MDKFVLFCKSYRSDLKRCVELSKSIEKYNVDNLPFYISVPKRDLEMFKNKIPYYTEIICGQEITDRNRGYLGQQFVKSRFYRLDLCEYYLMLDSDSYFIKDFKLDDFMFAHNIPYMVMHENNEFFEWMDRYDSLFSFDYRKTHEKEYNDIKNFLDNDWKKIYHYGPCPFIWNTDVWRRADNKFGIDELLRIRPNELKWYGELANHFKSPYFPCGPLFKCFHYKQQYSFYKNREWTEDTFKKQYFGIVMQSNWNSSLKY